LTSLVRNSKTGQYIRAHWVGTSFATPLVSGLAALLLEAGESPADVRRIIGNSAVKTSAYEVSLGDGVINIQNSLP
jgi:subtilisin family serine protease